MVRQIQAQDVLVWCRSPLRSAHLRLDLGVDELGLHGGEVLAGNDAGLTQQLHVLCRAHLNGAGGGAGPSASTKLLPVNFTRFNSSVTSKHALTRRKR